MMVRGRSPAFGRGRLIVVLGAMVVALLAGCVIDGQAEGDSGGDLAGRGVSAQDFPVSGATRVPDTAVPFALGGLSGSDPVVGYPAGCAPTAPEEAGAVVYSVVVNGGETSYTSAVAHVHDALGDVIAQARRCPESRIGGEDADGLVQTEIRPAPAGAPAGVVTAALHRTVRTGDPAHQTVTSSLTLLAQQGGVRVYAQYRWPGDGTIDPSAAAGLDGLFGKAVTAAFG
ncbi:hypothetical protein ACLQ3C_03440 [Gordonia sp. DT30]|uniref:hypothetical protein n=1 Tax=unclassified Gordonia (in: high G+C Gram-positive bacteria) TaxID=2657482 RepID=UPI003CF8F152